VPGRGDVKKPQLLEKRPAETITAAGAGAILLGWLLGIEDAEVLLALAVVLGGVPAAVTWIVEALRARAAK
jgi:hypothetical protein